jgi:hypothetical protein
MEEKKPENKKNGSSKIVRNKPKLKLALACDVFVDGKDRIAGYVVYDDGLVGDLRKEDFSILLKKGCLKVA